MNDYNLRPQNLSDFIGQKHMIDNLKVFIQAAQHRNEVLDHCLMHGPAGLGKTTLAHILANTMDAQLFSLSALATHHQGDLIAMMSDLQRGDVLFIDEIHRLNKPLQETLYTIMEDFYVDITVGSDENARNVRLDIEPFTLIGATTELSQLSKPFIDRFGIRCKFEYYDEMEIHSILKRSSEIMMCNIDTNGIIEISKRSRGTPRIANRYLKRVWDFATVFNESIITEDNAIYALDQLNVDQRGLHDIEIQYLKVLVDRFNGGPVGIGALSSILSEAIDTLEHVYEPYLLQIGMINRTPRGRVATQKAYIHLGIPKDLD